MLLLACVAARAQDAATVLAGYEKLRAKYRTQLVQGFQRLRAEREEFVSESDELAAALQSIEQAEKAYRVIYLRELRIASVFPNKDRGLAGEIEVRRLAERIANDLEPKLKDADGDEANRIYGEAAAWIRLAYLARSVRDESFDTLNTHLIRSTRDNATVKRMHELAKDISRYEVGHTPFVPVQDPAFRDFLVGKMQETAYAEYKRLAVAGFFFDPRSGRAVTGHARTQVAGHALRSLNEYLAAKGKTTSEIARLFRPRKRQLDLAKELEEELKAWHEYRLACVLQAGMEPSITEYFRAAALVVRFEQTRIDDWYNRDYRGGDPWKFGLGKLLRLSDASFTGSAGNAEVTKRLRKFRRETDLVVRALQAAAEGTAPDDLDEASRKLLLSRGYLTTSGNQSQYVIPKGDRAFSRAVEADRADLRLPGAAWLDVINPESVGVMLASVIVPELLAVEAEAMAAAVLSSERGIMAVRVLAEIGADIATSATLDAVTKDEKDRAGLEQLVLESAVLGTVMRGVGNLSQRVVSARLHRIAEAESDSLLRRLMRNPEYRALAESYITDAFDLSGGAALEAFLQAKLNAEEVDVDALVSSLVQAACAKYISGAWEAKRLVPPRKEIWDTWAPPWLKRAFKDKPDEITRFTKGTEERVKALAEAEDRLERILADSEGEQADRVLLALLRGDLTRREMNRIWASDPAKWDKTATDVSATIRRYCEDMVVEARIEAEKNLTAYYRRKLAEADAIPNAAERNAAIEAAWKRYTEELELLRKDPIIPGSAGPTSDIDRSSHSTWLRRQLQATYRMRARWENGREPPTMARALDANEYINVMPFIEECRPFAKRMAKTKTEPDEGLPSSHIDAKEALSVAAVLNRLATTDDQQRYLRSRTARIERELESVPPAERGAERTKRLAREEELVAAARRSLAQSLERQNELRAALRKERPELTDKSEVDLIVRDRLYDERMDEVVELQFRLTELERAGDPSDPDAIALRAKIDRKMTIAMRDGVETYSQPVGIDIIVNLVQSAKVRGDDGQMRKAKARDRLKDPSFTIDGDVSHYGKTDMACMRHDQYVFLLEHVHGFLTGHETPYETARAVGKYSERVFLARKIAGEDIEAIRRRPAYDAERRLLEVTEKLVANKDDPDAVRRVLASFAVRSPADPENGVFELVEVMDRALPDLRGILAGSSLGEARGPDYETTATNSYFEAARLRKKYGNRMKQAVSLALKGARYVLAQLEAEEARVTREMRRIDEELAELDALAGEYVAADWPSVLQLRRRLAGARAVSGCMPSLGTPIEGRLGQEVARIEAQLDAARERRGAKPTRAQLYKEIARYARRCDRRNYLVWEKGRIRRDLVRVREIADEEGRLDAFDFKGPWMLRHVAQTAEGAGFFEDDANVSIVGAVTIERKGDRVRIRSTAGDAKVKLDADGEIRGASIRGFFSTHGRPEQPDGPFEAVLEGDAIRFVYPSAAPRLVVAPDWPNIRIVRRDDSEYATIVEHWDAADKRLKARYRVKRPPDAGIEWLEHRRGGIRDGPWESWTPKGEPHEKGAYEEDVRAGMWTRQIGELRRSGRYVNGLRDGPWRTIGKDGVLTKLQSYRFGVLHGPQRVRHPDGGFDAWEMRDGIAEGLWRRTTADGRVFEYHYRNGVLHGPTRSEREAGRPEIGGYRWGYRDGPWEKAGARKEHWRMGLLHGPYATWWPNGKQRTSGEYREGYRIGAWATRREDGTTEWSANYSLPAPRPDIPTTLETIAAELAKIESLALTDDLYLAMARARIDGARRTRTKRLAAWRPGFRAELLFALARNEWTWKRDDGSLALKAAFVDGELASLERWEPGADAPAFTARGAREWIRTRGETSARFREFGGLMSFANPRVAVQLDSSSVKHGPHVRQANGGITEWSVYGARDGKGVDVQVSLSGGGGGEVREVERRDAETKKRERQEFGKRPYSGSETQHDATGAPGKTTHYENGKMHFPPKEK